jgi:hypothetical protein
MSRPALYRGLAAASAPLFGFAVAARHSRRPSRSLATKFARIRKMRAPVFRRNAMWDTDNSQERRGLVRISV